jgi:hypothetical protein
MAITNNLGCFIFFIKQVGVYSPCTDSVQRPFPGFPSGFDMVSMVVSSFLFIKIAMIFETSKCRTIYRR